MGRLDAYESSGEITEFKMLVGYPSSTSNFTEFVNTEFSDGAVEIMLTPVASKNPFVGFKVNRSDKSNYKILVKDNHGGTSLVEGQ